MYDTWLDRVVVEFSQLWPEGTFFSVGFHVYGLLAVLLVSATCGAVGSLVVGNRMAFFSDALAHCAFAGVGGDGHRASYYGRALMTEAKRLLCSHALIDKEAVPL